MTAPYGHNGVFPTLKTMIDFHNTRDYRRLAVSRNHGKYQHCEHRRYGAVG